MCLEHLSKQILITLTPREAIAWTVLRHLSTSSDCSQLVA